MKKTLITFAIGAEFEELEAFTGKYRVAYAEQYGWEYRVITKVPEEFSAQHPGIPFNKLCFLFKLMVPRDYCEGSDLVAFMDVDSVININAPDLAIYADKIPKNGFAAAEDLEFKDRAVYFPEWSADYYSGLEKKHGITLDIKDRTSCINSGVLLFKPKEVGERWAEIALMPGGMTGENRLCVYELQEGRCYILPKKWNVLWLYEKRRMGYLKPQKNFAVKLRNYIVNKYLGLPWEKKLIREAFENSYVLHTAFEHKKLYML